MVGLVVSVNLAQFLRSLHILNLSTLQNLSHIKQPLDKNNHSLINPMKPTKPNQDMTFYRKPEHTHKT